MFGFVNISPYLCQQNIEKMAHITENIRQYVWILLALCTSTLQSETLTIGQRTSQTIEDEIKAEPERSAGIIYSLPTGERHTDTPAPDGKKPFYISHFYSL